VSRTSKKGGTVVFRRKERARVVCQRRSPEGQNRTGRGKVLWNRVQRSSLKSQMRAGSRTWHLLAAEGAMGVPYPGNERVKMNEQTMAGQADAGSEMDMDGMELDDDCLVQVGSAGTGGSAVDKTTPAEKQKCEGI